MTDVVMWTNPFTGKWEPQPPRKPRGFVVPDGKVPKDLIDAKPAKPAPAKKGKVTSESKPAKPDKKGKKDKKGKDVVDAPPADPEQLTVEAIAEEMDKLREDFAKLKNRQGANADRMVKRYRYLTLAFSKIGPPGITLPKLWDDIDTSTGNVSAGTVEAKEELAEKQFEGE